MKQQQQHEAKYINSKEGLVNKAIKSAYRAKSYRGFLVGCAVLAYNGRSYRIFLGCNIKTGKVGIKVCAEQVAIMAAVASGYTEIVAIVVAGTPQEDEKTGKTPRTLMPCDGCREVMNYLSQEISDETIILTVHLSGYPREERRFCDLK